MKIGSLTLTGPYMLAPMAGVSDKPFRVLCHEEGASLVCMEMVSANAIKYHNKKTEAFVDISPREHPVSMQLFGPDPETIALAAEALKSGHTEAEIKEDVDAQISSFKAQGASYGYGYSAFLKANFGPYMNAGVFKQIVTRSLLAQIAQNEKSEALSNGYTTEDLEAYYGETTTPTPTTPSSIPTSTSPPRRWRPRTRTATTSTRRRSTPRRSWPWPRPRPRRTRP